MHKLPPILEFPRDDTIVAIATPPGRAALGIVRISGPEAINIVSNLWSSKKAVEKLPGGSANVGSVKLPNGISDTAVITVWRCPKSYTGQDLIELTLHGSPALLAEVEKAAITFGARAAAPGEFTLRAIMNGKLSVSEAGAISALIEAPGIAAARAASKTLGGEFRKRTLELIDEIAGLEIIMTADTEFPDIAAVADVSEITEKIDSVVEEIRSLADDLEAGASLSELKVIVIAGPPNVGKSTLANRLIGRERSIVHEEPGTTRDLIESKCDFGEICATLVDTAGLRSTEHGVELIGVDMAHKRLSGADLVILLVDGSVLPTEEEKAALAKTENSERIIALNKSDLGLHPERTGDIAISAKTGDGVEKLRELAAKRLYTGETDALWAASWQIESINRALDAARNAMFAAQADALDAALEELTEADNNLRAAIGENAPEDIIARVLENFCIGK